MKSLLITATDTNAGKTVLATALAAYYQQYLPHQTWALLKPIQSGPGDRELYTQLFDQNLTLEEINPLYYAAPLAPPIAANYENKTVDWGKVWPIFGQVQQKRDFVLLESLGGLGSPITNELTVADWARDWRLPTILVVPVKLGAIAQTVANVALARLNRVNLIGIVLNCVQPCTELEIKDWTPIDLIQSLTQIPVLGVMPYIDRPNDIVQLAQIAANLDLELIIGKR